MSKWGATGIYWRQSRDAAEPPKCLDRHLNKKLNKKLPAPKMSVVMKLRKP